MKGALLAEVGGRDAYQMGLAVFSNFNSISGKRQSSKSAAGCRTLAFGRLVENVAENLRYAAASPPMGVRSLVQQFRADDSVSTYHAGKYGNTCFSGLCLSTLRG